MGKSGRGPKRHGSLSAEQSADALTKVASEPERASSDIHQQSGDSTPLHAGCSPEDSRNSLQEREMDINLLIHRFLPRDMNALLYALFILVYLVCAVIRFRCTSDVTMLTTLLPYLSTYAGIQKVAHLLPWGKKENKQ